MSGVPLTERRISSAALAVLEDVEKAYGTVFEKKSADDRFFAELQIEHLQFYSRTLKRPITPRQVKHAQRMFRDACRDLMAEAKARLLTGDAS